MERVIQKALEKKLMTDEQPSLVSVCFKNLENILKYFPGSF